MAKRSAGHLTNERSVSLPSPTTTTVCAPGQRVNVIDAAVALLRPFRSGLVDTAAALMANRPGLADRNVTLNVAELFAASDPGRQTATLRNHDAPELADTRVRLEGNATPAHTDRAVAGPALRTVSVHLVETPTLAPLGHDNDAERSARVDVGGAEVTVTLNGPAVAWPTLLIAATE